MNTPTEILTKRTYELFQDWSCSKSYERQRMCHNNSIHRQKNMVLLRKDPKKLILSLLRKHDNALILRNKKASARRMASQIVTLSGLTRLKSALGSKYDMLSLIDIRASTRGHRLMAGFWAVRGSRIPRPPVQLASN